MSMVPGSMPRIILGGFSKRKYSGNLQYQFVDTQQKYQINPQLFVRTTGLLYSTHFNKQSIASPGRLAAFIRAVTVGIKKRLGNTDASGCFSYDGQLGY
jgi:hypothetical protein